MRVKKYAHPHLPNTLVDDKAIFFFKAARGLKSTTDAPARKAIEPGLVLIAIEVIISYFDFMYEVLHRWKRTL